MSERNKCLEKKNNIFRDYRFDFSKTLAQPRHQQFT